MTKLKQRDMISVFFSCFITGYCGDSTEYHITYVENIVYWYAKIKRICGKL